MTDDQNEPEPLSPAQEREIHDLLAGLPDPAIPDDIAARIAAALAEPGASPALTVLPGEGEPERDRTEPTRRAWLHSRVLQSAAALVVVAVVGVAAVGVLGSPEDAKSPTTASSGAAAEQTPGPITRSDQRYSAANLDRSVRGLLQPATAAAPSTANDMQAQSGGESGDAPTSTTGTSTSQRLLGLERRTAVLLTAMTDPTTRQRCVDQLAEVPGVQPLAVDVGRWKGKPAALILIPDAANPAFVEAWVVGSTCSDADDPFPYSYQRVARP